MSRKLPAISKVLPITKETKTGISPRSQTSAKESERISSSKYTPKSKFFKYASITSKSYQIYH